MNIIIIIVIILILLIIILFFNKENRLLYCPYCKDYTQHEKIESSFSFECNECGRRI